MSGFKKTERIKDIHPSLEQPAGRYRISPRMLKKFIKGIINPVRTPALLNPGLP